MLVPSLFQDEFPDAFEELFPQYPARRQLHENKAIPMMNADIIEFPDRYQIELELPGYGRDDIRAELEAGYLTISAAKSSNHDAIEENGKYIRRERYYGRYQRSFYVGRRLHQEDIKARLFNGILMVTIPKKDPIPEIPEKNYIPIEE